MVAINWRSNLYGRGSRALVSRRILEALDRAGVELVAENLDPAQSSARLVLPSMTSTLIDELIERRFDSRWFDSRRFAHVRLAGPQPDERNLIGGRFDLVSSGWNIWYTVTVGSSYWPPLRDRGFREAPHQFWVPSAFGARTLIDAGVDSAKVRVVNHGVDPSYFHPRLRPPDRRDATFQFLCIARGNVLAFKGLDVLVQAFVHAFRAEEPVRLLIYCRDGIELVEDMVRSLGLRVGAAGSEGRTLLLEGGNLDDWRHLYWSSDAYVQPSRAEPSFNNATLEALGCGLPVIVTAWGGFLDMPPTEAVQHVRCTRAPATGLGRDRGDWGEPDVDHLAEFLRAAYERTEADSRSVSAQARELAQVWTWDRAAHQAIQAVETLA